MSTIGDSSGTGSTEPEETPGQEEATVADGRVSDAVDSREEETTEELSRDLVFDVLKNRRRRYALHYLRRADGSVQLSELAEQVAAWENDTTVDAISAAERKRVYTALYQSHLPKLDDASIVEYNQNRGIVELSDASEQLDVYLDLDAQPDIPWCNWYLGLAVAGLGVLTAAWLGLPPFSLVADVLLATLIVAAYAAVALAHVYFTRHAAAANEAPPELQEA
ncbi:hypothetical protein NGM10_13145 [Halorussus salilacus]|uniref:DUF7344 domain-containing protein n=1 Tax=Halorussus salilacus TaxID=2953750 RepID=UPI00209EB83B|nr:hypothetical protein [Halorussus salilacus]USZ67670.1 hypothetical protein NGM10_13145 [Halorussus salilacus]